LFCFRNHFCVFLGQNGLRGYVDRIVQTAQQQVLDQPAARSGGGSTTSISRTYINTTNPNFAFGGSSGVGGISSLVSQSTRPTSSSYQTISSGIRSTFRDSTGSDNQTRRSGDY
jgi:hypothetical protein